jgi:hypothetical protein
MTIEIRDHLGHERKLGWIPPSNGQRKMRASRVSIRTYVANAGGSYDIYNRSNWKPVDFVTNAPRSLIEDQTQLGSCTAFTATGAHCRQRWIRGKKVVRLSGFWLYDQINGGRDAGSNIIDSSEVIRRKGAPPMESYTRCIFRAGQDPVGVEWYKEDLEITLTDFDDMAVALQVGILPQFPIDAGGNFERFDGNGVSTSRGSNPNHSVYAAGLDYINGVWVLRGVNSWTEDWGPFKDGTWYATERQINDCAGDEDAYGHASVADPATSTNYPAPLA